MNTAQQFRLGVIADFSELESVSTVATSENGEQWEITKPEDVRSTLHK